MAKRVRQRSLGVVARAEDLFHALYRESPVALWVESLGERGGATSVLAQAEALEIPSRGGIEQIRGHWQPMLVDQSLPGDVPLGLLGWLSYDLTWPTMGLDAPLPDSALAPSRLAKVTRSISLDHRTQEATAWGLLDDSDDAEFAHWCDEVSEIVRTAPSSPAVSPPEDVVARWRDEPGTYREKIERAREAIRHGEVYQLCLTTEVSVPPVLADWQIHRLLRESTPTQHQALLRMGDISLVSASPETFLDVDAQGRVSTRPIKGTRPRGSDPHSDLELAAQLAESDKERAENLMIVDLMRNDLQRVCMTGSVNVTGLFEVESYSSVHQLVSTVEGQLAEGKDALDALEACFPAGSMTGAPKRRAVSLLAQWESGSRGIYSGAWGWFRPDHSLTLAMTIRSAVVRESGISIGVGGGITWSSEPDQEIAEVGHKARRLLQALGVAGIDYS